MNFAPGTLVAGRYRLVRLLGGGGMGVVWAAKNEAIARDVAIKVMLPQLAEDPSSLIRFFNEARICGSIRHPGIVDVLDLGKAEDGSPFLVMELLDGEPLERRIERERRMFPSEILPIIRDIARTIALAHQQGVIHRDLKPANLFLHRLITGQVVMKVLDFGISKVLKAGSGVRATQTGAVIGSPSYMSPEHLIGRVEVDGRTDVYALGVILFEALTGRLPFPEENYNALIIDVITGEQPDIAALLPGLSADLVSLVNDAMARDRNRRIPTMAALADRVERLLPSVTQADAALKSAPGLPGTVRRSLVDIASTGTMLATTSAPAPRPSRWIPLGLVAVAAMGVLGVGLTLALRGRSVPSSAAEGTTTAATETGAASAAPLPSATEDPAASAVIVTPVPASADAPSASTSAGSPPTSSSKSSPPRKTVPRKKPKAGDYE